jgi:outer membrane protein OmpA-like peptidoglycan-associated protein
MDTEYSWQSVKAGGGYHRETSQMKNYGWWVSLAVLLSVLLHLGLYLAFENIQVTQLIQGYEKVVQLPVARDQAVIDDETWNRLLAEETRPEPMSIPKEEVVYEEAPPELPDISETIKLTPATDVVQNLFAAPEAPVAPSPVALPELGKSLELDLAETTSAAEVKAQLEKASQTAAVNQPTIYMPEDRQVGVDTDALVEQMANQVGGAAGKAIGSKFASLDTLLGEGIRTPSAEVLIPTDLLFAFGEYEVKEEAKLSLMKLGMLILANRDATFIFKGFTDSIPFRPGADGTGPRSNEELSLARADAVKGWLESQLGLEGFDLRTIGYGSAQPLVPPTGNLAVDKVAEAINRRVEVEIILKGKGTPAPPPPPAPAPAAAPVKAKPIGR